MDNSFQSAFGRRWHHSPNIKVPEMIPSLKMFLNHKAQSVQQLVKELHRDGFWLSGGNYIIKGDIAVGTFFNLVF